jgi:hypothetical protein
MGTFQLSGKPFFCKTLPAAATKTASGNQWERNMRRNPLFMQKGAPRTAGNPSEGRGEERGAEKAIGNPLLINNI